MNRNEEYQALLSSLERTPPELEGTAQRALNREKALRKKRRLFGVPAASLAACFTGFILLVNLFPPFAMACGSVPLLRELVKAVAWSPSLSAAVENEYVQPIEQTQTQNGVTASVHYVIVDRKNATIFYSLDTREDLELSAHLELRGADGEDLEGCSVSYGSPLAENGALRDVTLETMDADLPGSLTLVVKVSARPGARGDPAPAEEEWSLFDEPVREDPEYLAEFVFPLTFDPYFTAQGQILPVNQTFQLDGQTFTLTEAELYPTHLRVTLDDAPENTAWLKGLDLYLENERGERFESRINGTAASGDPEGEGYGTFWLDSPFFSRSEHLTLHITRAEWLDKDAPRVRLDLAAGTAEHLPAGARFLGAVRHPKGWEVSFALPYAPGGGMYNLFSGGFWDEAGNEYDIWTNSSTFGVRDPETGETKEEESLFTEAFPLSGLEGSVAYLEPSFNRVTDHGPGVSVPIN